MKRIRQVALVAAPVAALSLIPKDAQAQEGKKLSLTIGQTIFSDRSSRDAYGKKDWNYGVGVSAPSLIGRGWGQVELTYTQQTGDVDRVNILGLYYVQRVGLGRVRGGIVPYAGLGVGIVQQNSGHQQLVYAGSSPSDGSNPTSTGLLHQTLPAARAVLGVNYGDFFVEGAYDWRPVDKGIKTSGTSLSVGVRF